MKRRTIMLVLAAVAVLDFILLSAWQMDVFSKFTDWGHIPVVENIVPWSMWLILSCLVLLSFIFALLFLLVVELRQPPEVVLTEEDVDRLWAYIKQAKIEKAKQKQKSKAKPQSKPKPKPKPKKKPKKEAAKSKEPENIPEKERLDENGAPKIWKEEEFK